MSEGFFYTLEDEKILEYLRLSPEEKLTWLEEIVNFNNHVLGKKEKGLIEALKTGRNPNR